MATKVLSTANIPAKDIEKATFIENGVEYLEAGDFLINTGDKLSIKCIIEKPVMFNGRTFNLNHMHMIALSHSF